MRPADGVAWFLASAMLLLTLAGCGVFGLGALVLLPFDRLRDRSGERVVVVTATAAAPTATMMAPTVTAPAAVVVVEVAPATPTTVARSGLVLLPLVVGPVASVPAAIVAPVVMPTFTPWPTVIVADPFEGCFCTADVLNCGDTPESKAEGRRCYAVCMGLGLGDVHWLDGDSDGLACED